MNPAFQSAHIPVTFLALAYNEEARIRFVLEHAVRWADEVIIVNKSSTDRTKEICLEYQDKVKVVDVPYSAQGHEDSAIISQLPSNDWIFFATASEVPTRKLIERVRQILAETRGELDLIYVPRKYYSFGIHDHLSPWSVSQFPFLVNRKKAIIANTVHRNFQPRDSQNTATIEYSDDCCVYHLTHATAKGYLRSMTDYFEAEVAACEDPAARIEQCLTNSARYGKQLREGGDELLGHYFAWSLYCLGTALFVWEKWRGVDVEGYYRQLAQQTLEREWLQSDSADAQFHGPHVSAESEERKAASDLPLLSPLASTTHLQNFMRRYPVALEREILSVQEVSEGRAAYTAGNLATARRQLLFAVWHNPRLLRDHAMLLILLESVFGRELINRLRGWRRRLLGI